MRKTMIFKMVATVAIAAVATVANANPSLTLDVGASGVDVVGELLPGYIGAGAGDGAGQAADEASDANALVPMALGTSQSITTSKGTCYTYRSVNNFGTLPYAVVGGNAVLASGGGMNILGNGEVKITIGSSGYTYLVARWDGPNAGAEVWDISGVVNTTIYIPEFAQPDSTGTTLIDGSSSGQYGITSYSLFQGSPSPPTSAPEASSTMALLGGALAGLGLIRRKMAAK